MVEHEPDYTGYECEGRTWDQGAAAPTCEHDGVADDVVMCFNEVVRAIEDGVFVSCMAVCFGCVLAG